MFLLFLAAGLLKRTPDLPTSLAVAALLLLVPKPQRILDAGFQLSFSAVIGIAVMIPVLQDGWEEAAPSLRVTDGVAGWNIARTAIARACRLLRKNILAGLGITMTMLPFLLIHFYEWSPWSVLLNLAVIPLMGILLPCLIGLQLVARLTALVHCLELPQHLLCAAIEAIFSCYEQLCRFTTALPGSILHTGYPTWQALAAYTIRIHVEIPALKVTGSRTFFKSPNSPAPIRDRCSPEIASRWLIPAPWYSAFTSLSIPFFRPSTMADAVAPFFSPSSFRNNTSDS